jgi:hypothetical protein
MRCTLNLACLICAIAAGSSAQAATWRVERDGSGDFITIQAAVNASTPGDSIRIGPGRYSEMSTFSFPGLTVQTVVGIQRGPLTLLGAGAEQVVLGPAAPIPGAGDVEGISIQTGILGVVIEGLAAENLQDGILAAGDFVTRDCTFRGHSRGGVTTELVRNVVIESCFLWNNYYGALDFLSANVSITDCTVADHNFGMDLSGTSSADVRGCRVLRGHVGVQFDQGTRGTIANCLFTDVQNGCLSIAIGSRATVTGNTVCGTAPFGTWVRSDSDIIASGNVLEGGSITTIRVDGGSTANFYGNDIRRNGTWSVLLAGYFSDPPKVLKFEDNYWGTNSADVIASWIYDGHDDPTLKAFVDFEPFRGGSVPQNSRSFGSLKALFGEKK